MTWLLKRQLADEMNLQDLSILTAKRFLFNWWNLGWKWKVWSFRSSVVHLESVSLKFVHTWSWTRANVFSCLQLQFLCHSCWMDLIRFEVMMWGRPSQSWPVLKLSQPWKTSKESTSRRVRSEEALPCYQLYPLLAMRRDNPTGPTRHVFLKISRLSNLTKICQVEGPESLVGCILTEALRFANADSTNLRDSSYLTWEDQRRIQPFLRVSCIWSHFGKMYSGVMNMQHISMGSAILSREAMALPEITHLRKRDNCKTSWQQKQVRCWWCRCSCCHIGSSCTTDPAQKEQAADIFFRDLCLMFFPTQTRFIGECILMRV